VKEKFVALAVDGRLVNTYRDDEVNFLRDHVRVANAAHGTVDTVTASGKHLEYGELHTGTGVFHKSLERALKAWAALPASERAPGAVKIPDRGPVDPKRQAAVAPPPDTLIIRVYNRQLGRDTKGELRHTVSEDYIPALRDPKLGFVSHPTAATDRFREPGNDMMWVARAEWQAMMPANPRVGQKAPVPTTLCERLFRFHLDPGRGFGEGDNFPNVTASAGQLQLTVEEVTPGSVRLRLDGTANLHDPRRYLEGYQSPGTKEHSQFAVGSPFGHGITFQPRLLGYLAYDPARKVFTRFDVIAIGDMRGRPSGENVVGERVGAANPLGVAFELVTDPKPADYLSPKGLRTGGNSYDLKRYLGVAK
jgi:hypothetical protein